LLSIRGLSRNSILRDFLRSDNIERSTCEMEGKVGSFGLIFASRLLASGNNDIAYCKLAFAVFIALKMYVLVSVEAGE